MSKPYKFKYPDSLDLDDQLAYGVGSLVMHWGVVETMFYGLLECMAGRADTQNARVIWLTLRTTEARLGMIGQLAKVQNLGEVTAGEVQSACERFKGITRVRNYFCHAFYEADLSGQIVEIQNLRLSQSDDPLSEDHKPLNKATLNEIAHAVGEALKLNIDMWKLLIRLRQSLGQEQLLELPEGLDEYLARGGPPHRPDKG